MGKKTPKDPDEIDWSLYPEGTTEIPNPNFYYGDDGFLLQNGDIYVGDFCAHRMGITWREGTGVYFTKDNHTYEGVWENDQLLESTETKIIFPDSVEYRGCIQCNQYSGPGKYILPNKLPISCNFMENTPYGEAVLTDPQNHLWKGIVGEESVILLPENHFYVNLSYKRGVGRRVHVNQSLQDIRSAETITSTTSCARVLKHLLFKKSLKTIPENFGVSEEKINERKRSCNRIIKPKTSLLKAGSGSNVSLLKTFLSKEYRNSCPPVSIFRPTVDMEKEKRQSNSHIM